MARQSGDPVDASILSFLTTGRVVSHYLSGTQTRRIGPLVEQYPEPKLRDSSRLAAKYGIDDGDWVKRDHTPFRRWSFRRWW